MVSHGEEVEMDTTTINVFIQIMLRLMRRTVITGFRMGQENFDRLVKEAREYIEKLETELEDEDVQ